MDAAVVEVISEAARTPKFAAMMQDKINSKIDTTAIEQEIAAQEKALRQMYGVKTKIIEDLDSLDPDDRHYMRQKTDLDDRLYSMYDKIDGAEDLLIAAKARKQAIEAEKISGNNIYKTLIYFDKLYGAMSDAERRQLMESMIAEVHIYEERQPNGQWLKSVKFSLPFIREDLEICLDNHSHDESVVLLTRE